VVLFLLEFLGVLGVLAANFMRIGQGFDAHALVAGRKLIIGGVEIPHDKGLAGHSDADVLIHAVCDALLGAAGLGDIGAQFPDTDARYKDVDSRKLLREVARLLAGNDLRVVNVDATIIAQAPKMAPHIVRMRNNLAADLGVPPADISVKAKTTERLGFTGRGEGIAAEAVALVTWKAASGR
jgi:2-C-methyl-D-erythritol 2,4-cyclodiphosphate synthase